MNVRDYADQFGDRTFTSCIEDRLRQKWGPEKLQNAIRGTYSKFPEGSRETLDEDIHQHIEQWCTPEMQRQEMRIVFLAASENLRANVPIGSPEPPTDEQIIDVLNIMMMKVTRIAYLEKPLRKMWGIKKTWWDGWF